MAAKGGGNGLADGTAPGSSSLGYGVDSVDPTDMLYGALTSKRGYKDPQPQEPPAAGRGVAAGRGGRGAAVRGGRGPGRGGRGAGRGWGGGRGNGAESFFERVTRELDCLLMETGGKLPMMSIASAYRRMFGHVLNLEGYKVSVRALLVWAQS